MEMVGKLAPYLPIPSVQGCVDEIVERLAPQASQTPPPPPTPEVEVDETGRLVVKPASTQGETVIVETPENALEALETERVDDPWDRLQVADGRSLAELRRLALGEPADEVV